MSALKGKSELMVVHVGNGRIGWKSDEIVYLDRHDVGEEIASG